MRTCGGVGWGERETGLLPMEQSIARMKERERERDIYIYIYIHPYIHMHGGC